MPAILGHPACSLRAEWGWRFTGEKAGGGGVGGSLSAAVIRGGAYAIHNRRLGCAGPGRADQPEGVAVETAVQLAGGFEAAVLLRIRRGRWEYNRVPATNIQYYPRQFLFPMIIHLG